MLGQDEDDLRAVFFFEAVDFFATRQGPHFAAGLAGPPSVEGPPGGVGGVKWYRSRPIYAN